MPKYYVVHPGEVTLNNGTTEEVDAGTLAARYGLSAGEYEIDFDTQEDATDEDPFHVHLYPRPDGKYKNIKTLLGDNGTDLHTDKMVGWRKKRRGNRIL